MSDRRLDLIEMTVYEDNGHARRMNAVSDSWSTL